MAAIDAGVVFLPRFTTLVGDTSFATAPLDVSRQGGVQFQVWRGPIRTSSGSGTLGILLQESFDGQTWSVPGGGGPTAGSPTLIGEAGPAFFSYTFRLRWFRVVFDLNGTNPMVTCWAEGLLRGGGEGMWGGAHDIAGDMARAVAERPSGKMPGPPIQVVPEAWWDPLRRAEMEIRRSLGGGGGMPPPPPQPPLPPPPSPYPPAVPPGSDW